MRLRSNGGIQGGAESVVDDFGAFAADLAELLDLDAAGWAPSDPLADRLPWDSLTALEVVAWLDDGGVVLPDELLAELRTLGDLHHYARSLAPGEPASPRPRPPLQGRRVRLVPFTAAQHGEALDLLTAGDHLTRYRLRGVTPSPEAFARLLWDRVLVQFAVVIERRMVGLVTAIEADMRNRHVHVAAIVRQGAPPGVGMEGLALLVEHLFVEFDLRKVYAEVLAPNAAQFASGIGRLMAQEGRLVEHEYVSGRYEDVLVLAIDRARWEAHASRLLGPRSPAR